MGDGDMGVGGDEEAQGFIGPLLCVGDADAGGAGDLGWGDGRAALDGEVRALGEVLSVEVAGDVEGLAELGGTGGEVGIAKAVGGDFAGAVSAHEVETFGGLQGADETGGGDVGSLGDDVAAEVHAVGEVDVGGAAVEVHAVVARGVVVVVGVGGAIGCAEVGFGFDDGSGGASAVLEMADEGFSEQGAGDGDGVAAIEASGESG